MLTKKPGPPVPPRPNTGLIKSRSESPTTRTTSIVTGIHKITSSSSSDAGRTVIYKSPSFDLKKRQEQHLQDQLSVYKQQPQQQQQQQEKQDILVSDTNNTLLSDRGKSFCESSIITTPSPLVQPTKEIQDKNIEKSLSKTSLITSEKPPPNRTEIVIINNVVDDFGNNSAAHISTSNTNKNMSFNSNDNNGQTANHDNVSLAGKNKISPVPRPRTTLSTMKSINMTNSNSNQSAGAAINNNIDNNEKKSAITINTNNIIYNEKQNIDNTNNNNNNNINNNTTTNNTQINIKNTNIEIENNLKNVAERLFTEIIINQKNNNQDMNENSDSKNISKTEHCISVRSTPSPTPPPLPPPHSYTCTSSINNNNSDTTGNNSSINRTCVNLAHRPEPEGGENVSTTPELVSKTLSTKKSISSVINKMTSTEKKVAFHEMLISELAAMRVGSTDTLSVDPDDDYQDFGHYDKIQKYDAHHHHHHQQQHQQLLKPRKRYPSGCSTDSSPYGTQRSRIRTSDWVEVGDNGKEVMLTSCHISLEDSGLEDEERLDDTSSGVGDSWDSVKDAEERMSLPGLPPLPKSLSGLELTGVPVQLPAGSLTSIDSQRGIPSMSRMSLPTSGSAQTSTLDTQLAILRREMFGLRQLDLSLLSQLWTLNESIMEFRTILQEQETLSPPSPSPSPSDANSVSSGDEDDMPSLSMSMPMTKTQLPASLQRMRSAPPPPPPARKAPQRPV